MVVTVMNVDQWIEFSDWYRWGYLYVIPLTFSAVIVINVKWYRLKLKKAVWLFVFTITLSILHHIVVMSALRIV